MSAPRARSAERLTLELYTLVLRHPRDYPDVLEDPPAYWQELTEQAVVDSKMGAVSRRDPGVCSLTSALRETVLGVENRAAAAKRRD